MRLLYIPFILLAVFIASCRCHDYYKCSSELLAVGFVGFAPGEADTVILKRYANDGTYSQLIDSTLQGHYTSGADTLFFNIYVEEGYDYAISLPAISSEHTISAIKSEGNYYQNISHGCTDKTLPLCFNRLASYRLDGIEHEVPHDPNSVEGPGVYIVK